MDREVVTGHDRAGRAVNRAGQLRTGIRGLRTILAGHDRAGSTNLKITKAEKFVDSVLFLYYKGISSNCGRSRKNQPTSRPETESRDGRNSN